MVPAAGQARTVRRPPSSKPRRSSPPAIRNPNLLLFQRSIWIFAIFALAAVVAFWPSYFSRVGEQPNFYAHAHGAAMSLWCLLLVAQAALIRTNRRAMHKRVGLLSYALVPLIVASTIGFIRFRVRGVPALGDFGLYFLTLVLNGLVAFVAIYTLAMYHRRRAAPHARYMIATIFPLFTPITDRLIGRFAPALIPLLPRIDGAPILPAAGFMLADLCLATLAVWDWRTNRRTEFTVSLAIVLLYQASVFSFYRWPWWQLFGAWFARQA